MALELPNFNDKDVVKSINEKVAETIAQLHEKGIATTHADEKGIYTTDGKDKERIVDDGQNRTS